MLAISAATSAVVLDAPPWRLSGTVYGALLNHRAELDALGAAVNEPPYKAAPRAPVVEVKPRHTHAADGAVVRVPRAVPALRVGASLGVVIGAAARRVEAARALSHVAGYLLLGDVSVPVPNHYRPGARFKARDGFCPLGAHVVPAAAMAQPDALHGRVQVDGRAVHRFDTSGRVRGVAQLIADVSEFMTLRPGDVLALGVSHGAPLVAAGSDVVLTIDGVGALSLRVEAEAP
jgi:5-oxopent-3-ene-1,2,5-tricarboxylate decarboxylase/2-hydroxyhepta-2,4-diene-1,7-dioate isomerase